MTQFAVRKQWYAPTGDVFTPLKDKACKLRRTQARPAYRSMVLETNKLGAQWNGPEAEMCPEHANFPEFCRFCSHGQLVKLDRTSGEFSHCLLPIVPRPFIPRFAFRSNLIFHSRFHVAF